MARARLRDRHQENLKKKLNILIQEQGVEKVDTGSDPDKIDTDQPEQPSTSTDPKTDESESE